LRRNCGKEKRREGEENEIGIQKGVEDLAQSGKISTEKKKNRSISPGKGKEGKRDAILKPEKTETESFFKHNCLEAGGKGEKKKGRKDSGHRGELLTDRPLLQLERARFTM